MHASSFRLTVFRSIAVIFTACLVAGPFASFALAQFEETPPADGPASPDDGFAQEQPQLSPDQQQFKDAFDAGNALQEQGDHAGAIEEYRKTLAMNPRFAPSYLKIGQSFSAMEDWEQARSSLAQAELFTRQDPQLAADINFELGKVALNMGPASYQDAVDYLTMAASAQPANADILYHQGSAMLKRAQTGSDLEGASEYYVQAVDVLERAIELDDTNGAAYADRGRALLQLGDTDGAIEDLQTATDMEPDVNVLGQLAYAYYARGRREASPNTRDADTAKIASDYRESIASCDKYLSLKTEDEKVKPWETPDPNEYRREQIILIRAQAGTGLANEDSNSSGLYQAAIQDCDAAIDTEDVSGGTKAQAYFQKGIAQRMLSDYDGAIKSFGEAMREVPSFTEANLRRGIIYFRQGEYDLALQDFEAAAGFQEESRAMFWSGLTLAQQNDLHGAIKMYTRAVRSDPGYQFAYMNRGLAYMNMRRYTLALSDFNQVIRLNPDNDRAKTYRDQAKQRQQMTANR